MEACNQRRSRRFALCGATALALSLAAGAATHAQTLGPLRAVTNGPSPFHGCTADDVKQQELLYGGVVYKRSAVEPYIAFDPLNPLNQIVVTQQDRWSNGGSRGTRAAFSADGGATWTASVPEITLCSGGIYQRASDPWVTVSPNGTVYFGSLVTDESPTPGQFGPGGQVVNISHDGGKTWSEPKTLIRDTDPTILNDKNSITADPNDPTGNTAYAVWDRVGGPVPDIGFDAVRGGAPDGVALAEMRSRMLRDAAAGVGQAPPVFKGPTYFARTRDGGDTWDRAVPIYDPGINAQTINNIIRVTPTIPSLVEDFFVHIPPNGTQIISMIFSTTQGLAWSKPPIVVSDIDPVAVVTPFAHEGVRGSGFIFSVAVDNGTGALYVVWGDGRFSPGANTLQSIAFSQSLDFGFTWSAPIKVNQTPPSSTNPLLNQAFIPAVAVAFDGTITVTYYDFRNDTGGAGVEQTDFFAAFCSPATSDCSNSANWGHEVRITNHSFNMLDAPTTFGPGVSPGHFVGDYTGLISAGRGAWPVFGVATGPNVVNLYTRQIFLPTLSASAAE
jgi:hypothetical protein